MQAHVARQLVDEEVALVPEVVRHRAVRFGERDILIKLDDLLRDLIDVLDLRVHLAIDEVELLLHVLRRLFETVGELLARLDDGNALRRVARVDAEVVPCAVELVHRVLQPLGLRVVEYRLDLVVILLAVFRVGLCRLFLPILLVREKIAGSRQRLRIDAGADEKSAKHAALLQRARSCRIHALARIAFRVRVRDVVPHRIEGQLIVVDAANHRVQSGKCRSHFFTLFLQRRRLAPANPCFLNNLSPQTLASNTFVSAPVRFFPFFMSFAVYVASAGVPAITLMLKRMNCM